MAVPVAAADGCEVSCAGNAVAGPELFSGRLLSINDTAAWIWEKAGELGDFTTGDMVAALCEVYDVDPATALTDVEALLTRWKELGILE